MFLAHKKLHHKFAISGGVPNVLLSYGTPDEVRAHCKKIIDDVAREGGYIMDASAIMQNDTSIENLRALTDFTREYGVYSSGSRQLSAALPCDGADVSDLTGLSGKTKPRIKPGVCLPWEEKLRQLPKIQGDEELVERVWESVDALGAAYIWQLLLSF